MYLTLQERNTLVNEIYNIEDLATAFDLTAFPLPIRVGKWQREAATCWNCHGEAWHVYMRILPRGKHELNGVARDNEGKLELNTCTFVTPASLAGVGPAQSIEKIRIAIKHMVLHEIYEALLFRGERIMDPHNGYLRPEDQPF